MKTDSSLTRVCAGAGLVALDVVVNRSGEQHYVHVGGSCANVIAILGFLGWAPHIVARLGKDPAGLAIKKELKILGVSLKTPAADRNNAPTPIIVQKNSISRGALKHSFSRRCPVCGTWFPSFSPVPKIDALELRAKLPSDLLVFYFDRVSAGILELVAAAKKADAVIVFEPSSKIEDQHFAAALKLSDIVKYSDERHSSIPRTGNSILEIRTFGAEGLAYRYGSKWKTVDAYRVENVIDQAGAGDWCTAGIVHNLINSREKTSWSQSAIESALQFGQALGALSCLHEGARGLMYQSDMPTVLANVGKLQKSKSVFELTKLPTSKPLTTLLKLCSTCSAV